MKTLTALMCCLPLACSATKPVSQPAKQSEARKTPAPVERVGDYARVDLRFELPDLRGNPFDIAENDIFVTVRRPDGSTVRLPAFFDGGATWRVRFTPSQPGRYSVAGVTRNARDIPPVRLNRAMFTVEGTPRPGFVRRDPKDPRRFVLDSGEGYYPVGHNAAWGDGKGLTIPGVLDRMGRAGENWARIWMDHWDGKNLDWVDKRSIPPGTLDLEVARRWDGIVDSAEKSGVRFQMVLQHHGQVTTYNDSNWASNPWNAKNGGFLASPEDFFTNPRAIALTKSKYRYIIARWGYSTSVMAWELFNEVQWTNAVREGRQDTVAAWHNQMADFLRKQDPYHHLVTSSSDIRPEMLGDRLDYWQPHLYVSDPLAAVASLNGASPDLPAFIGEIGPAGDLGSDDGSFLRRVLWGSLMSEASGAAEYWAWDLIDRKGYYALYRPATAFVKWSGLAGKRGLRALPARVETSERGPLSFAPGAGWAKARQTEFTVSPSGEVPGLASMPRYLQGNSNRAMFPSATFQVECAAPATVSVRIGQSAKAGARVVLSVDGQPADSREFPAADQDTTVDAVLEGKIPAGRHAIRLENTGADWATLDRITLDPYAPRLGVLAKGDREWAVLWAYRRDDGAAPITGRLTIPGLQPGAYNIAWWDTDAGKVLLERRATAGPDGILSTTTPPILRDAAALLQRLPG